MEQPQVPKLHRAGRATRNVLRAFEQEQRRPMYALEVANAAQINDSSVAHVLHRLGELHWLEKGEPQPNSLGPPRTYWRLTDEGNKALDRLLIGEPIYEPGIPLRPADRAPIDRSERTSGRSLGLGL